MPQKEEIHVFWGFRCGRIKELGSLFLFKVQVAKKINPKAESDEFVSGEDDEEASVNGAHKSHVIDGPKYPPPKQLEKKQSGKTKPAVVYILYGKMACKDIRHNEQGVNDDLYDFFYRIGLENVNNVAALKFAMEELRDEVFVAHIFQHSAKLEGEILEIVNCRNGVSTPEKPVNETSSQGAPKKREDTPDGIKRFKRFHGVTTAQLVMLVYKVTVVFNKVNAVNSRVTTAVRVSTAGWIKWLEDQDMRVNEIY
nr:hypothetical protein [Tanacetum cinerariifolium]